MLAAGEVLGNLQSTAKAPLSKMLEPQVLRLDELATHNSVCCPVTRSEGSALQHKKNQQTTVATLGLTGFVAFVLLFHFCCRIIVPKGLLIFNLSGVIKTMLWPSWL